MKQGAYVFKQTEGHGKMHWAVLSGFSIPLRGELAIGYWAPAPGSCDVVKCKVEIVCDFVEDEEMIDGTIGREVSQRSGERFGGRAALILYAV